MCSVDPVIRDKTTRPLSELQSQPKNASVGNSQIANLILKSQTLQILSVNAALYLRKEEEIMIEGNDIIPR